jgi:hypothetical protein
MWTALAGPVVEIVKWLLTALVGQAVKPRGVSVLDATPTQRSDAEAAQKVFKDFKGVKIGMVLLACTMLGGCFEPRLIIARPSIPVRLIDDIPNARVLVKQPDGTELICRSTLFAGSLVVADPSLSNEQVAKDQNIHPEK